MVEFEAFEEGFVGFGETDGEGGFGQVGPGGDAEGFSVEEGSGTEVSGEEFVAHGIVDDTDLGGAVLATGDGDAEMGDAVAEVDGAVDGVDDPFGADASGAVATFFPEDVVVGMGGEEPGLDEGLDFDVDLEFDVVSEGLFHHELGAEGLAEVSAGLTGGLGGEVKEGGEVHGMVG